VVLVLEVGDTGKDKDRFVLQRGINFGEGAPSLVDAVDVDGNSSHSISVGNPKAVINGADTAGVE